MSQIKPNSLYRLKQIVGDRSSQPPIDAIIPISRSAWWKGVKEGKFPKPVKLSPKVTVWRGSDLQSLLEQISGEG